jgi:hypothetical protein
MMTQENQQATQYQLAAMGNAQAGRVSGLLSTPFDPNASAPGAGNASNILGVPGARTGYDAGGNIQMGLGDAGAITKDYGPADNYGADRQRIEEGLMARIQPQLTKDRSAIEQRLADQGIRYGSQAYASAMDDYNRQSTDARFAAIGQGGAEQQRMNDMAAQRAGFQNAAQQQQYTQNLGAGSFANAAQQQQNAQNASQAGFYNAGVGQQLAQQQSGFNAQNAQRNQYMQEAYQQRNQPLNEITSLMSGSQMQNPNWLNTPSSQIATTDIGGLINQNFAQQSQNYQAANQNWQSTMGGLLGLGGKLGGAAIMASDRRVKENIKRMGTVFTADIDHDEPGRKLASFDVDHDEPRAKLPIYEYSYKDDPASIRHVGPMAQDVEQYDKKAVKSIGGVKHIDVNRVMGGILRAA